MNQNSFSASLAYLFLFTLFLLSDKSLSVDPQYEACTPKSCGSLDISYPFYIQGQQESFCGYPGFELNCSAYGYPILRIPENDYVVEEIFYTNQSLRVYNSINVSSSNSSCLPHIRNITLERDELQFGNVSNLNLLSKCSSPLPEILLKYEVGCDAVDGGVWGLAMLGNDTNLRAGMEKCETNVVAPVEVHGDDASYRIGEYEELLRRGFVLKWKAGDCSVCQESGGRCGFDLVTYHFKCFCPDRPHVWSCTRSRKSKLAVILGTVTFAAGIGILITIVICFRRKFTVGQSMPFWRKKTEKYQNVETFLKNYGSLAPKRYSHSDVRKMTNSFKVKLGQGGYGCVYRGQLCTGSCVAVKVLNESKGNGEEFINEVASIGRTSHVNIVTLLGFCFEGRKRALIYEFMPNGSLEKFIYDGGSSKDRQLGWEKLYQIAIGIARGLEYLHRGCNTQILHFDIKPHNILLDENFCPKISDFGLAKLCPTRESIISMLTARGTVGYIAPEVFCRNFGGVSHKSDVYSYGMMVLEMVGGRKNIKVGVDRTSEIYFPHWIYKKLELDKELGLHGIVNEEENERARKMVMVSLWCIQNDPSSRPSMTRVVEMLEGSLESLQIPPKPFLSSPQRSPADSSTIEIS